MVLDVRWLIIQEILEFMARYCGFLWTGARYRIVGSELSTSFGGDAVLTVASDALRMRFVRDRGQLFLDVQRPDATATGAWYSTDLICRIITGKRQETAILDSASIDFVRSNLAEIESLFDIERVEATERTLRKLKNLRSKEIFG
jgi:hypothetical protein